MLLEREFASGINLEVVWGRLCWAIRISTAKSVTRSRALARQPLLFGSASARWLSSLGLGNPAGRCSMPDYSNIKGPNQGGDKRRSGARYDPARLWYVSFPRHFLRSAVWVMLTGQIRFVSA